MLPRHACTSWTASTDPFGGWRVVGISTPGARSATGRDPHRNVARQPPLKARAHPSGTGRLVATPSRVVDRDRFDLQIATKSLCETSGQRNEATRPAPAASRAGPPGTNSGLSRSISPTVHPGPRAEDVTAPKRRTLTLARDRLHAELVELRGPHKRVQTRCFEGDVVGHAPRRRRRGAPHRSRRRHRHLETRMALALKITGPRCTRCAHSCRSPLLAGSATAEVGVTSNSHHDSR